MRRHRRPGGRAHHGRIRHARGLPFLHRPADGQIAVDRIVRGGLIGQQVGPHAAPEEFGKDLARVAQQAHGHRSFLFARAADQRERFVDVVGGVIEVAGLQPHVDARALAFDGQAGRARHHRRQRLRAAHAAETRGEQPAAGEVAAVVLAAHLDEGFVGALHDALRADVDPRAGRHLAVHHEALAVELVEVFPGAPARHEIGVGQQHARRVGVCRENAHRFTGLDQQRLIGLEALQGFDDAIETVPVARGAADAAVDHELFGTLGHRRVEVVHEHAQRRFGEPALCARACLPVAARMTRLCVSVRVMEYVQSQI